MLALITGAGSGLGKALAKLLESEGYSLILCTREHFDLADENARNKLIQFIQTYSPDLVINNAGFGLYGEALLHSTEEQMEILEVNAKATLQISLETARTWRKLNKGGTIVNISSAACFFAYPTFATYAASKAFVTQFSLAFDAEMKPHGIRILTSCPGQIDTGFRKKASKGHIQKPSFLTMSAEKAARIILSQIKAQKNFLIFTWPYRLLVFLSHFIPRSLLQKVLRKTLSNRYDA